MQVNPASTYDFCCIACSKEPREDCRDSFSRRGIFRVHWECWSACNLSCAFCFRSRSQPVPTAAGFILIRLLKLGGIKDLVFAGGDPSLRPDLPLLVDETQKLGIRVEVQSNMQWVTKPFLRLLSLVDRVGLSLDSANPEIHDQLRGKHGNFKRVIEILRILQSLKRTVRLHTVVVSKNAKKLADMAAIVNKFSCIERWSLMEFSPIGDGAANSENLSISREHYISVCEELCRQIERPLIVKLCTNEDKHGAYAMLRSDGEIYGTVFKPGNRKSHFETFGSIFEQHLADLSARLPFDVQQHQKACD
jgi:MoaA/NifB/PqqE/SkfB family radical SAM enzyme